MNPCSREDQPRMGLLSKPFYVRMDLTSLVRTLVGDGLTKLAVPTYISVSGAITVLSHTRPL